MKPRCSFEIVYRDQHLVRVRDIDGPVSVTNDAEAVVAHLVKTGVIQADMRLEYYDSDGNLDEIRFDQSGFVGFEILPR